MLKRSKLPRTQPQRRKTMRQPIEMTLMRLAELWAARSTCSRRAAVGSVLVNSDMRVLASGYNGSPKGFPHCDEVGCTTDQDGHCVNAVHAEENVILQCAVGGISTKGLTLYTTHAPCRRCAIRIVQAQISHVVFRETYGSLYHTFVIFQNSGVRLSRLDKKGKLHALIS